MDNFKKYDEESPMMTFTMTRNRALLHGLLTCGNCGYPVNNHFDGGKGDFGKGGCAHDKNCKAYKEVLKAGIICK